MQKKSYKGRCEKRKVHKSKEVCRLYSDLQISYVQVLEQDESISEINCNFFLDGLSEGDYTSDFLCKKTDGSLMVRECVERNHLMKPMTVKLLDLSREYWRRHGVDDWGIVTNKVGDSSVSEI